MCSLLCRFWTVVLEKTLESPSDSKEIKPVNPTGNQPWMFIRRTDTEAESPLLWPPNAKNWLIRKDMMLGKIEGKKRRGWQRIWGFDGITIKLWEMVKGREVWHVAVHGVAKSQIWLSYWKTPADLLWAHISCSSSIGIWLHYHWTIKKPEHQRFDAFLKQHSQN